MKSFSLLLFSDVRRDTDDAQKYGLMSQLVTFADQAGFEAVYIPERHFSEFGSVYANSAIIASYLIPQTRRIRFRTAGVSLPLHHPAEVVEWWAMNDVLSGGRVDLGFGSGWSQADFVLSPGTYHERKKICGDRIPIVQKLWRGETVPFPGVDGVDVPIRVFPRPVQKELNVWLLVAQNPDAFVYAGKQGYNIFTMLYGVDLDVMGKKIELYRKARKEAGHDPEKGIVSLMLHTLVHKNRDVVRAAVEKPFKEYIRTSMEAHLQSVEQSAGWQKLRDVEKQLLLEHAYQRYYSTGSLFGGIEDAKKVADWAFRVGVNDIACLLDFGADYSMVLDSLPYLKELTSLYK